VSINGIGQFLNALENRMRREGHTEADIKNFRARSVAKIAMLLPMTSLKRRARIAAEALKAE
jgi:outer membrane PBP1 activator LpoA protein